MSLKSVEQVELLETEESVKPLKSVNPLESRDFYIIEGVKVMLNWRVALLPWDICFNLEWEDLKEVMRDKKANISGPLEKYSVKVNTAHGLISARVSDLLQIL